MTRSKNIALVVMCNLLTQCQSNAGAGILKAAVRPLKDAKDLFGMLLAKTNAVVAEGDAVICQCAGFAAIAAVRQER